MAKYSVGGTEIITDSATIAWSKIKNHPLPTALSEFYVTTSNCSQGGAVYASVTSSGQIRYLNVTVAGGGANYNCQCQCQCDYNCLCQCQCQCACDCGGS